MSLAAGRTLIPRIGANPPLPAGCARRDRFRRSRYGAFAVECDVATYATLASARVLAAAIRPSASTDELFALSLAALCGGSELHGNNGFVPTDRGVDRPHGSARDHC